MPVNTTATHLLLKEAEAAMHALMTGTQVIEVKDQNGETLRYNQAKKADLAIYIETLKQQLGILTRGTGPMRVFF